MKNQSSDTILMVRPANFGYNFQTAENNFFQSALADPSIPMKALQQFDNMVDLLRKKGVDVWVAEDSPFPVKPDAIFPNNWFTCNNNEITLFPMYAQNRRIERNPEIISLVMEHTRIRRVNDLSVHEQNGHFLEGSGSMCYDHLNRKIYACRSARTSEKLLTDYADHLGYSVVLFNATDINGRPVYHTNVLLTICDSVAIVCDESIEVEKEKDHVMNSLARDHKIISITRKQMHCFAGNMLQLRTRTGEKLLAMSTTAFNCLSKEQLDIINKSLTPVVIEADIIEQAGGSVRCMMAEIFY